MKTNKKTEPTLLNNAPCATRQFQAMQGGLCQAFGNMQKMIFRAERKAAARKAARKASK